MTYLLCIKHIFADTFDTKKKEQSTTIDLALPEEAIMGTESCRIAAFGNPEKSSSTLGNILALK